MYWDTTAVVPVDHVASAMPRTPRIMSEAAGLKSASLAVASPAAAPASAAPSAVRTPISVRRSGIKGAGARVKKAKGMKIEQTNVKAFIVASSKIERSMKHSGRNDRYECL